MVAPCYLLVMLNIRCRGLEFREIQAVIFDKDGTLENSANFLYQLAQKRARLIDSQIPGVGEPLLMAYGITGGRLDLAGLMAVGSRPESLIASAAYVAETGQDWIAAKNLVEQAFDEADKTITNDVRDMYPGSRELLTALHATGVRLGMLSNAPTEDVEYFVLQQQLGSLLSLQMGADGEVTKPDPSLFLTACDRLQVAPSHTLMIGDSAGDIEMAQRAGGMGCIAVAWGVAAPHLHKATVVIDQLEEIEIF
jgi:phosphoglycolate phosphatase